MNEEKELGRRKVRSKITEKNYGWLRDARKFFQIPCANAKIFWNTVRRTHPHLAFGTKFTHTTCTEILFLSEEEIRNNFEVLKQKYDQISQKDLDDMTAKEKAIVDEFEELACADSFDAVEMCYVSDDKIEMTMKYITEEVVQAIHREMEVKNKAEQDVTRITLEEAKRYIGNTNNNNNFFNNFMNNMSVAEVQQLTESLTKIPLLIQQQQQTTDQKS